MVCDSIEGKEYPHFLYVLILVLMEYGLRHLSCLEKVTLQKVLILVLMEYGLRQSYIGERW